MPIRSIPRFALPFLLTVAAAANPRFASDVLPILRAKCIACHGDKAAQAGLTLTSRDALLRGGHSGAAVLPGKPNDSLLLSMVSTGRMPVAGPKLNPAEVDTLRQWIEQGALNAGESPGAARPPVAQRDVETILSAKCWVCHGRREQSAGLDLRSHASLLRGGRSGPALVPGNPEASLLVQRIAAQQMPPPKLQEQFSVRGLTEDELAKVKQWIAEGARPDSEKPLPVQPAADPAIRPQDRAFWSFHPPQRGTLPATGQPPAVGHPIDALLPAKLPPASPQALLRRAYFDLTGLPPTPEQFTAYKNDYPALLDQLLASPRYAERWARHWLDAVGYADSEGGNNSDLPRKNAWRYRDYVVRAIAENKPYDRFLTEQLAGDELFDHRTVSQLTPAQLDLLAATGFWRMAPDGTNSTEQNFIPERMDVIAGQLEIFGSAVLGLSLGCARCHDHKYDPLPTRDYYRLVAVLTPAFDPYAWLPGEFPCGGVGAKCDENNTRYYIAKATPEYAAAQAHNAPINARIQTLEASLAALDKSGTTYKKDKADLEAKLNKERALRKTPPLVRALFDLGPEPPPTRILLRGDVASPGPLVEPGPPSILSAGLPEYRPVPLAHSSGRRLALAQWLTHPAHPLTARVIVNRIWQQHFGTGLVSTPGNFGRMGAAPTNQPLLDFLAAELVRTGWDLRAIHRLIMTSAAYRQQAGEGGFPLRRIDAESIRDSILQIAGRLDTTQFGPPDPVKTLSDGEVITTSRRRSLYVEQRRTRPVSLLETFDQPFMNPNCVQRGQSVVSSQALHLMNSDLVRENARFMAGRIADAVGDNPAAQIERAYLLALARKPTAAESAAALDAFARLTPEWTRQLEADRPAEPVAGRARWLALSTLCYTLINSAEFLYLD
ncbi:MAG: PSD1 and planctomycete cytochrome C domain-containing protein [Acidobacteria bacterium]|nr:PSD1 and planctomycete cytochrome C domain-containing protein [Acidobacteriota bacterium]